MALSTKQKIGLTGKHTAEQAMALLLPIVQDIFPLSEIKKGKLSHQPKRHFEDVYISKGHARKTKDKLSIGFTRHGGKMWVRVASQFDTPSVNYKQFAITDLDCALKYLNKIDTHYKATTCSPAPALTKTQRKARRVAEIMKLPVNQQAEAMMNLDKDTRQKRDHS